MNCCSNLQMGHNETSKSGAETVPWIALALQAGGNGDIIMGEVAFVTRLILA